jgi:hypothetical protein
VTFLLSPRLNLAAGLVVLSASVVWTILSITLTSEPANVLAMSGVALCGFGVQLVQGSLQLRKIEEAGSDTSHLDALLATIEAECRPDGVCTFGAIERVFVRHAALANALGGGR